MTPDQLQVGIETALAQMDRTIVNLVSLIVGGSGLFVVLTKFNVPELNMTFLGHNPFAIKRDAIDSVMTWIFTGLTLLGIFIQILGEIWTDRIPSRQHTIRFYFLISVATMGFVVVATFVLTAIGNRIAKRSWLPEIVAMMAEGYAGARFIVDHDGCRKDQLDIKDALPDKNTPRKVNFESAKDRVVQIEKLLDLPSSKGDLKSRLERLKPYFDKPKASTLGAIDP